MEDDKIITLRQPGEQSSTVAIWKFL